MITRDGALFHIDFGHFLGHVKKKMGITREVSPFVFTNQFADVLGGKDSRMFAKFEQDCCNAFNIIRRRGHLFMNLLLLMLSSGLPELQSQKDVAHIRKTLVLEKTDEEASQHFKEKIIESLNTFSHKALVDMPHLLKNPRNQNKGTPNKVK